MYNFNHLYYFYITVKSGGVTSAAKHLCISQPSLSGQLKVLEDYLQIKLFNKVGRKNKVTTDGAIIFGYCKQMFEISEDMHESLSEKIPYDSRRIYIGVDHQISNCFVVEVISHFLSQHSEKRRPKVLMVTGNHEKLSEQLRFREIDVLVTTDCTNHQDLVNLQNINVPVNLICPKDKEVDLKKGTQTTMDKLLRSEEYDIEKILQYIEKEKHIEWVMPSQGLKLRAEINQFFELHNIKGKVIFESDVIESITRSVVDNNGLAFLPIIYVPQEIEHKTLCSIGPEKGYWKYRICLASHTKMQEDKLVNSFATSFKSICHQSLTD